jgi:N-acetyltransferase
VSIRVVLSFHLRALAHSGEVALDGVDTGIRPGPRNARAGREHNQRSETLIPCCAAVFPSLAKSARSGAAGGKEKRGQSGMSFELQPVLKGKLLALRPLQPADFHDLYAVASDPLIWEQHPVKDRHQEGMFSGFFQESLESGGALIAIDSKSGQVIGSSRFHGYDEEKSEIEIGWTFLARSHWGGTYNGEMKQLMLGHAFQFVNRVVFLVGPQNLRSQKAMEKIGGVRVGSRPDAAGRESFVYEISASTFLDTLALR